MTNPILNKENGILRTSLPLFSASLIAQGINFLTLFLMPWLYSADEIGPFFVFSAIGQILVSLVSLRSPNSIVLSRNEKVAVSNLGYSLLIGSVFSVLVYVPAMIIPETPLAIRFEKWMAWLPLIPVYCLSGSIVSSLEYYLNYAKKFRLIGLSYVVKNASILILTVTLGWFYPFTVSIILAVIIGQVLNVLFVVLFGGIPFTKMTLSLKGLKFFVLRYREILVFNTIMAGLQQVTSHLPIILLSLLFDAPLVAYYGISYRVFATPLGLWGMSVSQVFFKRCVDYFNQSEPFYNYALSTLKKMVLWVFPFGLMAALLAPRAFSVFLGADWVEAGDIGRLILPLILIQSVAIPFTVLFNILRTQRRVIWYYLIGLIVRVFIGILLPWFFFDGGYRLVLIFFSAIGVLYYLFYIHELLGQVKRYDASAAVK